MKTYQIQLESVSPYSSSRYHNTPRLDKESPDDYEKRTWREKLTTNEAGLVVINPMAFKFAMSSAAKYLGKKIKGKGQSTYGKIFDSGILIIDPLNTGVRKEDAAEVWVHANSDGRRGGGKRVMRCFPTLREWKGTLIVHVLDQTITKDILIEHLEAAGNFKGVGQYRPENGGLNGRFRIVKIEE